MYTEHTRVPLWQFMFISTVHPLSVWYIEPDLRWFCRHLSVFHSTYKTVCTVHVYNDAPYILSSLLHPLPPSSSIPSLPPPFVPSLPPPLSLPPSSFVPSLPPPLSPPSLLLCPLPPSSFVPSLPPLPLPPSLPPLPPPFLLYPLPPSLLYPLPSSFTPSLLYSLPPSLHPPLPSFLYIPPNSGRRQCLTSWTELLVCLK